MKWHISVLSLISCSVILVCAESNECPDSKAVCPEATTCCQLNNNTFGCCPVENAVCCKDSMHCCPVGYSCDIEKGVCKLEGKSVPLLEKVPSTPVSNEVGLSSVSVCPGGEHQCPVDHSCCPILGSSHFHCCPSGYSCDQGVCQEAKPEFPAVVLNKFSAKVVKCNKKLACPDRYTCCKADQGYLCCPLEEAVCCADHKHCCPRGYTCSPDGKGCSSEAHSILALSTTLPTTSIKGVKGLLQLITRTFSEELQSHTFRHQANNVVCPDGQSECPDNTSCCKLSSGQWGCCPFPQAVCCSDGEHCCPNGYTCDVEAGSCTKGDKTTIPVSKNIQALKRIIKANSVVCPDGQSECPDGSTCCKLSSGQWGCCPLPEAVCCSDGVHCCPNGYTCDVAEGTCTKGDKTTIPVSKNIQALKRIIKANSVVCPDGQSECPDGNTCCKLSSGQWGCCPLPEAVCCSDRVHCCPNGYTCDVAEGTCTKGDKTKLPVSKNIQALKRIIKANSVVCPDGQSECPDGNTCCKLSSGQWGCCPLPEAVCCSDGVHCCPNGYTCDVAEGTCTKGDKTKLPVSKNIQALKRIIKANSVVCPDGQSECPDGNTCCKLSSGQWGCCPLPEAVCCSDGVHCCPNGYTCDVAEGTCTKGDKTKLPVSKNIQALKRIIKANSVVCPDGQSECPDGNTCCKLSSGQWGCCPLPEAVCCSDRVHCCPNGYTCDVAEGTCTKGDKTKLPVSKNIQALKRIIKANSVVCPDGQSECPDGNTCCKLSSGQWGCCPLPEAVCCSDGVHCCPNGYTCDVAEGTCTKGDKTKIPVSKNIQALKRIIKANSVVCPDGQSECPDGSTCCKLSSGQWGCCPLPEAVCCSDGVHCCPDGYTCDVAEGTCSKGDKTVIQMLKKIPAFKRIIKVNTVCPDGQSQCPDGMTCCKLSSGQWGCCPLPKAVCCSDGVHCCPNGYTCDVEAGSCTKGDKTTIPVSKNIQALKRIIKANSVVCPDGQSECPDGNTCCKLSSGQWGCCPLPEAVCCSDGVHCCPNGYTCDVAEGTCTKGDKTTIPVSKNIQALKRIIKANSVVCPDGQSECPDGNTCCKLSSGQWGCCPLPEAVCCSDGVHCCPNGYTCDVAEGTCTKGDKTKIPVSKNIQPLKRIIKANSVVCPDGQSECPDGNTCCKLSSGQWGCCPLPEAVCCSDGVHCCPNGYTCDVAEGTCSKGDKTVIQMLKKIPAFKRIIKVNTVCPDSQSQRPDGMTCCKLSSGQWGCCPLPKAVCCSDGVHCCPNGYTCDVEAGSCTKGDKTTIPVSKNIQALKRIIKANSVFCPDGQSECPDGNTCCKLSSGQWGCCPLPEAVCCSDGVHCCPNGYTCDVAEGTCTKGDKTKIPVSKNIQALKKIVKAKNVVCPDGTSECPDGSTCCKLSSGQWGCCPLPEAVCCSDGVHCCPDGYTCDVAEGTCSKGDKTVIQMSKKIPAFKRIIKVNTICPDGQSQCPDGNTCCKLSSGQWGCCPLPKAVCCSDGVHCCPNGYTCDVAEGTCSKGDKTVIQMSKKIQALKRIIRANNVVCPDGQSECPDGSTCCKLFSGQWGCCPLPKAVCCSDGEHCCPNGYTCDVEAGTCNKGSKTRIGMLTKIPAIKKITIVDTVMCPDGESQCPDDNTCCKLSSGQWGCCPLPKAVCCSDGEHCCPNGYTCDVALGTCTKGDKDVIGHLVVQPSKRVSYDVKTVFCNDGETECPNGYTCCRDISGGYSCCHLDQAVCCSDKVHCCPMGSTCTSNGTCQESSSGLVQKMITLVKSPARPVSESSGSVLCPDKKHECANGSTCCKLHSGLYGCCPVSHAVCCSDDKHCCPGGYTCDVEKGTCDRYDDQVSLSEIIPFTRASTETYVDCPDGSQCLDYETCCMMDTGHYGCCPLPKAVCCSDEEHCCPEGYRCDLSSETCVAGDVRIPMLIKTTAARRHQNTQKLNNLDEKIRFIPGPPVRGNP